MEGSGSQNGHRADTSRHKPLVTPSSHGQQVTPTCPTSQGGLMLRLKFGWDNVAPSCGVGAGSAGLTEPSLLQEPQLVQAAVQCCSVPPPGAGAAAHLRLHYRPRGPFIRGAAIQLTGPARHVH